MTLASGCFLLPGYTADDIMKELKPLVGNDVELAIYEDKTFYEPTNREPDMGLSGTLSGSTSRI